MKEIYDYLIVGGGITGSALSYELACQGQKVLLVEKDTAPDNATLYSYGGLAYWSGTTEFTRKLYREGIDIHRNLGNELGADTQFREIDLLLTIDRADDPVAVAKTFESVEIPPRLLTVAEAIELEPLLNPEAIAGALLLPHGHIHTEATNRAYQQAFIRHGGTIAFEPALELLRSDRTIQGVRTPTRDYSAQTTIICTGGLTRSFLQSAGIAVPCYFTRAGLIALDPTAISLRTLVMPAIPRRILLEQHLSGSDSARLWQEPSGEMVASVLETGAVQFLDRSMYLGQVSTIVTDPSARLDARATEIRIREAVGTLLPALRDLPGTYRECLVAFAPGGRPLIGPLETFEGIQIFSGFTSTLVAAPPFARHFARYLMGEPDEMIVRAIENR